MDMLQEKIKKLKNPSIISLEVSREQIPAFLLEEEGSAAAAYGRFCRELCRELSSVVPGIRVPFGAFALLGPEGLTQLSTVLKTAAEVGLYVLLELPALHSPLAAENAVTALSSGDWCFDGVVVDAYLGTDILRVFEAFCAQEKKSVFVVVRTGNKSAPELQDLMTGGRLVHAAAADIVGRMGQSSLGKFGYSRMGLIAPATAPDALRALRSKYNRCFLLMDGYDYPSGNAKNCSYGFDKLGRGAVACAGTGITAAWMESETPPAEYAAAAVEAALRMKKNLTRYITIL